MAAILSSLRVHVAGAADAQLSLRSVLEVLIATDGLAHRLAELFPDLFSTKGSDPLSELRLKAGNLFHAEPIDGAALRAGEIFLKPSERYIELVAAIARDRNVPLDFDLHGWPILSSVSGSTTIAGRAEAASLTPEGR